jgi:hypothetical protein
VTLLHMRELSHIIVGYFPNNPSILYTNFVMVNGVSEITQYRINIAMGFRATSCLNGSYVVRVE